MSDKRDMNMELPICPACEEELAYIELVPDDLEGDIAWFKCHGYCPQCGREYRWYDRYHFTGIVALECVGERECEEFDFSEDL